MTTLKTDLRTVANRTFYLKAVIALILLCAVLPLSCKKDNDNPKPKPELKLWCGDFESAQCLPEHWEMDELEADWSIVDSSYNGTKSLYVNIKSLDFFKLRTTITGLEQNMNYELGFHAKIRTEPDDKNPAIVLFTFDGDDLLDDFVVYSGTAQPLVEVDWAKYSIYFTNHATDSLTIEIAPGYILELWIDDMYVKKL